MLVGASFTRNPNNKAGQSEPEAAQRSGDRKPPKRTAQKNS